MLYSLNNFNSPVRSIGARVELFKGSTLADTYTQSGRIKTIKIERVGDNTKFFGYGICQKVNLHLIDKDRELSFSTDNSFKVFFNDGGDNVSAYPKFFVNETHRDENTNELSITAYDALYEASKHVVSELNVNVPYTMLQFARAACAVLGVSLFESEEIISKMALSYPNGANFEGTENLRDALNAIAEATQTIYYIDCENNLMFKTLDINGVAALTFDKDTYITLESGENRRLTGLVHATELGDNLSVYTGASGTTQYIRNNPFWELREDVAALLQSALNEVGGLTINKFNCKWRGNPLVEIGDKVEIITKDNNVVYSYILDDVISYDGALSEETQWNYEDNDEETTENPASLGEALKQTFAKVDKTNKEIEMMTSRLEANTTTLSQIQLNTESITNSVKRIEENVKIEQENTNQTIATLTSQVSSKMSADDMKILVQSELANGTNKVVTETGFTFDNEGLTVSKSGSEMTTTITEDGMTVYRDDLAVLTANNQGVEAANLHAVTYLWIGENSRIEDFEGRTGCFWVGG